MFFCCLTCVTLTDFSINLDNYESHFNYRCNRERWQRGLKSLLLSSSSVKIIAGARNTKDISLPSPDEGLEVQQFDFEDINTFKPAFQNCDTLFLLRPPQLADVNKYFKPLIEAAKECKVKHIVFLSVQGVENSQIIPHHKIEKLIVESKIPYTFLRPAYFMQNFTGTLREDIVNNKLIFLPSGQAKFTIIDVWDIGLAGAIVLSEPNKHINKCYELTNYEQLSFSEMAAKITSAVGTEIKYISPNLFHFFIRKRKQGVPTMFILVMIMLHYFPRFQKTPDTTEFIQILTGQTPKTFDEFLQENKHLLR